MRNILVALASLFLFVQTYDLNGQAFSASITSSGSSDVCLGDSVKAYIYFSGGQEPFDVVLNNREGEYRKLKLSGASNNVYTVYLKPVVSDSFYIASAIDNRGRSGSTNGEIEVTVNESTPVAFDLDRTVFLSSESWILLKSNPTGAEFIGQGVTNGRFYPEIASYENSPHTITCTLINAFGCESTDETDLYVLSGEASLHMVYEDDTLTSICDKTKSYTLIGDNNDGIPGRFELFVDDVVALEPIYGHITDEDTTDNVAILDPMGLSGSYEVYYTYGVNDFEVPTSMTIEISELGVVEISGLPGKVCESDTAYLLVPEVDFDDPNPVYIFSGPGIIGNQEEGFYFDAGSEDVIVGRNFVALDYTSSFGCNAKAEQQVTVQFAPKLSFSLSPVCLPENGGLVSFDNTTSGKYAVENGIWGWDFGDPDSGDDNYSNLENPSHFYSEPGTVSIKLTASTDYGCVAVLTMDTVLADQPEADFTLLNDCFIKGEKTLFLDNSISAFANIDRLTWTFKTKSGGVLGTIESDSSAEVIEFPFTSLDQYQVSLHVTNEVGCSGDVTLPVDLRPVRKLQYSGYYEDFNGQATGWEALSADSQSSWLRDEPDFFGFQPEVGDLAWYTDLPAQSEGFVEQSWFQS